MRKKIILFDKYYFLKRVHQSQPQSYKRNFFLFLFVCVYCCSLFSSTVMGDQANQFRKLSNHDLLRVTLELLSIALTFWTINKSSMICYLLCFCHLISFGALSFVRLLLNHLALHYVHCTEITFLRTF